MIKLDSKIPEGPLAEKWTKHKFNLKLVNPANKRKYEVIVVGTGLAGASAAASLAELGYCLHAARRLGYISEPTFNELEIDVKKAGAPLSGLIGRLAQVRRV